MKKLFVYLIKSENRLIIVEGKKTDKDLDLLLETSGHNLLQLESICKAFCSGYINGSASGERPINKIYEFTNKTM